MNKTRDQFSIIKKTNKIFFDNAATSLTLDSALRASNHYYYNYNINIGRSTNDTNEIIVHRINKIREKVANLFNCESNEVIFSPNVTLILNALAYNLVDYCKLNEKHNIVLTSEEHISNYLIWEKLARIYKFEIRILEITNDARIVDIDKIDANTKIVSVIHMNNFNGNVMDISKIIDKAKENNSLTIIDGAQYVAHNQVNFKELDCDFYLFSHHKMFGLNGSGTILAKNEIANKIPPLFYGGSIVKHFTGDFNEIIWTDSPEKHESGTPNIGNIFALEEAIDFIEQVSYKEIHNSISKLSKHFYDGIRSIDHINIHNTFYETGIFAITVEGIHVHDIATILDQNNIFVRVGKLCSMLLHKESYQIDKNVVRISFQVYNTKEEVDKLVEILKNIEEYNYF